jgi:hypothetical protein
MSDLVIGIFGCHTVPRYMEEMRKINETWKKYSDKVTVLFFLGGEPTEEFSGPSYIYNKTLGNDYISASYKQYYGLKYIYENYKPKFVFMAGSDTYINVPKLLRYLRILNHEESLYIGGHGDYRRVGEKNIYFHSGGGGFIITLPCLALLYPGLSTAVERWIEICKKGKSAHLNNACDVGIAYLIAESHWIAGTEFVVVKKEGFFGCGYKGTFCCKGKISPANIITCHNMTPSDFIEFDTILKKNGFFLEDDRQVQT